MSIFSFQNMRSAAPLAVVHKKRRKKAISIFKIAVIPSSLDSVWLPNL
jgi:hypothetical protein